MGQVREQAREEAQRVLSGVRRQESQIRQSMKQDLNLKWQAEKQKEIQELQQEYEDGTRAIGQAHKLAEQQVNNTSIFSYFCSFSILYGCQNIISEE